MFGSRWARVVVWLVGATWLSAGAARAELVEEVWRSPYGNVRAVAVDPRDGSCWAAVGGSVMHLRTDGSAPLQFNGFTTPASVAVDPRDGSCWVADRKQHAVIHLAPDGSLLWRGDQFTVPFAVSVSPLDGSCWVADIVTGRVTRLTAEGGTATASLPFSGLTAVAAAPDGSCWVTDSTAGAAVHLAASGAELGRITGLGNVGDVGSVADGSVWTTVMGMLVRFSPGGVELARAQGPSLSSFNLISLDPTDGSCWTTAQGVDGRLVCHFASDGTLLVHVSVAAPTSLAAIPGGGSWLGYYQEGYQAGVLKVDSAGNVVWQASGLNMPGAVAANASDGSCWVEDCYVGAGSQWELGRLLRVGADGQTLWQSADGAFGGAFAISAADSASCWVADHWGGALVHLDAFGHELGRASGLARPWAVSANTADGWAWATSDRDARMLRVASDGTQLCSVDLSGAFVSTTASDGSCWVVAAGVSPTQLLHFSAAGAELARLDGWFGRVAAGYRDGSCWASVYSLDAASWVGRFAADGTVLYRSDAVGTWEDLVMNADDGSCWTAYTDWETDAPGTVTHLSPTGAVLWRRDDFDGPVSVSVNSTDDSCWVADSYAGQVIHLAVWLFADIPPDFWARVAIKRCVQAGIAKGYEDDTYRPAGVVSRDQMAVFIARALTGGDAEVPTGPATAAFKDVPTDYWAFRYIEYAAANHIVQGYAGGVYRPAAPVDRGQMAVFIARAIVTPTAGADLADYTPPATATFPDVPTNFWAYKYVEYIAQPTIGVIKGYPDGLYHPEYPCTRDQMAVYVARAFKLSA